MAERQHGKLADILMAGHFAPRTWRFWCSVIVCFCLCCYLGHALEVPYCTAMDALFGIVDADYAVFNDPWYVPYWVYGFGALGMTFLLEPLRSRIVARRRTFLGALAESFLLAVLLSMALELVFGLLVNQPDANGVYPYWDNSQLPGNILQQAWIVNDLFIGLAATVYLWGIFPLVSALFARLHPLTGNMLFSAVAAGFSACCCATVVYLVV